MSYSEEKRANLQNRDRMKREQEMKEFTGKPQISLKSKKMFADLDKMIEWEQKKYDQKLQEYNRIRDKKRMEYLEATRPWNLCKGTEKYLSKQGREQCKERIEDLLMRKGREYFLMNLSK